MFTYILVEEETKKKLEELLNRVRAKGVEASMDNVIKCLVELGIEEEEKLIKKLKESLEEDDMLKLLENPVDWGAEDASIKIDEALYPDRDTQLAALLLPQ